MDDQLERRRAVPELAEPCEPVSVDHQPACMICARTNHGLVASAFVAIHKAVVLQLGLLR
jgi:hypothetical protein